MKTILAVVLNKKLGYKFLVVLPSQVLQLFESCIILLTLGYIYPGLVYRYVFGLNNIKNKFCEEVDEDEENAYDYAARIFYERFETEARRGRNMRILDEPGIRLGTHGHVLREQFRPVVETARMEIVDFGIRNDIEEQPETAEPNYQWHLVGTEPIENQTQND